MSKVIVSPEPSTSIMKSPLNICFDRIEDSFFKSNAPFSIRHSPVMSQFSVMSFSFVKEYLINFPGSLLRPARPVLPASSPDSLRATRPVR